MSIEFEGTADSLLRGVPLRHQVLRTVLGVPVRYASNSASVIEVVESAFRVWPDPPGLRADEVQVTIIIQPGDEGGAEHARLYYRIIGADRVLFASHGSAGIVDPQRREAIAYVTPALAGDRQHFRYGVVEAMTMALVTPLDRQPFHAAAIVRGGAALLLAGPSGVGKSSLAYAALRAGFGVLAEDMVFLQSRPRLRIWGLPGFIHLPPDLRSTFPELAALTPSVLANGKTKIAFDLEAGGALPRAPMVERAAVCILARGGRRPTLRRLSAADVLDRLEATRLEPGFDIFADTIREPLEPLTARGGWLLELAADPREAIPLLERMMGEAAVPAA